MTNKKTSQLSQILKLMFVAMAIVLISNCNRPNTSIDKTTEIEIDSNQYIYLSKNTIYSIPSPLQINLFIKHIQITEDESLVSNPVNISNYNSSLKKALNIGILGADLGYLKLFPNTQNLNQYLLAIKQLSKEIDIEEAIDTEILKKIEINLNNNDSTYKYIGLLYQKSDEYLKSNSRQQTSSLIIAGGWIESLYILTQLYKKNEKKELYLYISQQKYTLENLIKLLSPFYKTSNELSTITDKLVELAYEFDIIDLNIKVRKPISTNTDGVFEINSTTEVQNSMNALDGIIEKTFILRNYIVL